MHDTSGQPQPYPGESPEIMQSATWVGGWLSPILVTLFTIVWVLLAYVLIGDRPTDWKYGVIPYVPGESIVSSEVSSPARPPRQVELPPVPRGERNATP